MFRFFKKEPKNTPPHSESNNISNDADLRDFFIVVMQNQGHKFVRNGEWLFHKESGYKVVPQLLDVKPPEKNQWQTTTLLHIAHSDVVPQPIFEYQHSFGASAKASIEQGFEQWAQLDFVTLLDALRDTPTESMVMEMQFDSKEDLPVRRRRVIFGPVAHFQSEPSPTTDEEHPFCSCCLFTQSIEAYRELLMRDDFYGLRLFASRTPDGHFEADCRVNGEEWEEGKVALRAYSQTWPPAGLEFRKQYVVIQTVAKPTEA